MSREGQRETGCVLSEIEKQTESSGREEGREGEEERDIERKGSGEAWKGDGRGES